MIPGSYSLNSKFIVSVQDWQNDTEVKQRLEMIVAGDSTLTFRTLAEDMEESKSAYDSLQYMIYGLSAFLIGFALINLINTLVSNAMSRKREFAMLRSIGMGAGQLSRMIIGEGLMLAARNLMITSVLGTAAGYALIVAMRNFGATYLYWHFPIWYLLGYAVLVQRCGINSEYSTCLLRQYCVVVSQRWSHIASILRLALTQKSGTVFTVNSATLY